MRFRFRAWHKDVKQMLQHRDQGFEGDVFNWLREGQPIEIMQSTGLHDKNGKEIFEGDILEEGKGYFFEVVWDETYAKFHLEWRAKAIQYPGWNRGVAMEIVGNIYETPELIPSV